MSKTLAKLDDHKFIINLGDEFLKIKYYEDRIKELEKTLNDYKTLINSTIDKVDYIKSLEGFRDLLTLDCIILSRRLTIFQCTNTINTNKCKFYIQCKPRIDLIKKINHNFI